MTQHAPFSVLTLVESNWLEIFAARCAVYLLRALCGEIRLFGRSAVGTNDGECEGPMMQGAVDLM